MSADWLGAQLSVAGVLAPTVVAVGLGWAWARWGMPLDRRPVTELITKIGAPCLVFSGLVSVDLDLERVLQMAGATLAALGLFGLVGAAVLGLAGLQRSTFLNPLIFGNVGNMGLPLCLFAFGPEGLALALCVFAVVSIVHYTLGVAIWSGEWSLSGLFREPLSWSALLAAAVLGFDLTPPRWVMNTTQLLGGFTVPLMLLTLGMAISELRVRDLRRHTALGVARLSMGVAVGFGLAAALGLEGVTRGVFVLECSMPVAVFNYLMAQRYAREPEEVAGVVVVSTLLAFAGLPFLLAHLL